MSKQSASLWLPDGMNVAAGQYRLVQGARDEITHAPFLDRRFSKGRQMRSTSFANADKLIEAKVQQGMKTPVYIFHTAFCCSTLLARALNLVDSVYSLKEPNVMLELANAHRSGPWVNNVSALRAGLHRSMRLIAALAPLDEVPLIKPTNAANNLLPLILESDPEAKVLILHSDLSNFLVSVLSNGEEGRGFVRFLFNIMMHDAGWTKNMDFADQMRLTDLQVAALVWRLQTEPIRNVGKNYSEQRIRSLHVDAFLEDPADTFSSLAWFFNINFPQDAIDQVLDGPILKRDSKQEEKRYDAALRAEEMALTKKQFSADIEQTILWTTRVPFGGFDDGKFMYPLLG